MGPKAKARKTTRPKRSAAPRAKLASLRVSKGFREFVLDQLAGVREFRAQAMFGGVGLYSGDVFFGILAADVLYFKVGDTNRAEYEQAGSKPFKPYADRLTTMQYYEVPVSVLENGEDLKTWARRAIEAAERKQAAKRRS